MKRCFIGQLNNVFAQISFVNGYLFLCKVFLQTYFLCCGGFADDYFTGGMLGNNVFNFAECRSRIRSPKNLSAPFGKSVFKLQQKLIEAFNGPPTGKGGALFSQFLLFKLCDSVVVLYPVIGQSSIYLLAPFRIKSCFFS